jgi:hypothetical protein
MARTKFRPIYLPKYDHDSMSSNKSLQTNQNLKTIRPSVHHAKEWTLPAISQHQYTLTTQQDGVKNTSGRNKNNRNKKILSNVSYLLHRMLNLLTFEGCFPGLEYSSRQPLAIHIYLYSASIPDSISLGNRRRQILTF